MVVTKREDDEVDRADADGAVAGLHAGLSALLDYNHEIIPLNLLLPGLFVCGCVPTIMCLQVCVFPRESHTVWRGHVADRKVLTTSLFSKQRK